MLVVVMLFCTLLFSSLFVNFLEDFGGGGDDTEGGDDDDEEEGEDLAFFRCGATRGTFRVLVVVFWVVVEGVAERVFRFCFVVVAADIIAGGRMQGL
jgi:hypothetical protein